MPISDSHSRRRKWLTHYAPLIVWIVVILGLGGSIGSMNETSRFIRPLLEFLFPAASPETITIYHGYIREFGHIVIYAVLGCLAFRAFTIRNASQSLLRPVLIAFVASLAVALTDEFIQLFNPERTGTLYDVAIDMAGAVSTIVALSLFRLRSRTRTIIA